MGHFNQTKESLKSAIELAIPEGTVSGNWFEDISELVRNLPWMNVRISPMNLWDVYDRDIGEATDGSIADYHFQIFTFHSSCCEPVAGECTCEEGKYVQDVADRIESYLLTNVPVGYDIDGISVRESETLRGPRTTRICRVIVEGRIQIKRID